MLAYNLKRVINILDVRPLIQTMQAKKMDLMRGFNGRFERGYFQNQVMGIASDLKGFDA